MMIFRFFYLTWHITCKLLSVRQKESLKKTKRAGVVFVKGSSSGSVNLTNNTWNNLGTLPSGYRPKTEVNFVAQDRSNNKPMMGKITTDGIISLYPEGGNSYYWIFTGVFPVVGGGSL